MNTVLVTRISDTMYDPLFSLSIKLLLPQPLNLWNVQQVYGKSFGGHHIIIIFGYMHIG